MNRLEYLILKTLYINDCNDEFVSMTITEIMDVNSDDDGDCLLGTRITIYRKLKKLLNQKYIKQGITDDHAHTFYLDIRGLELFKVKEEN